MPAPLHVSEVIAPGYLYTEYFGRNWSPFFRLTKFREGSWELKLREQKLIEELNISRIKLLSPLSKNEKMISGRERKTRLLVSGHRLLDVSYLTSFLLKRNAHKIPNSWKGSPGKPLHIFFDGNEYIRRVDNVEFVFFFCWRGNKWTWSYRRLDHMFGQNDVSAVVPN